MWSGCFLLRGEAGLFLAARHGFLLLYSCCGAGAQAAAAAAAAIDFDRRRDGRRVEQTASRLSEEHLEAENSNRKPRVSSQRLKEFC